MDGKGYSEFFTRENREYKNFHCLPKVDIGQRQVIKFFQRGKYFTTKLMIYSCGPGLMCICVQI